MSTADMNTADTTDAMQQSPILVVFPHPDDETFALGHVLALHVQAGACVTYLCGTLGEAGRNMGKPFFATRETLPAIREGELRAACDILGIRDLRLLGLRDKTLEFGDPEQLADLIEPALRELRPARVYTYYPGYGYHPDHDAMSQAVVRAVRRLPPEERPLIAGVAVQPQGVNELGEPDEIIDVTPVAELHAAAVRAHWSQSAASILNTEKRMQEDPAYRAEIEEKRRNARARLYHYPLETNGVRPPSEPSEADS